MPVKHWEDPESIFSQSANKLIKINPFEECNTEIILILCLWIVWAGLVEGSRAKSNSVVFFFLQKLHFMAKHSPLLTPLLLFRTKRVNVTFCCCSGRAVLLLWACLRKAPPPLMTGGRCSERSGAEESLRERGGRPSGPAHHDLRECKISSSFCPPSICSSSSADR